MNSFAQLERGSIDYRVVGQGPTVLVLNGGHTNCNSPIGHEQFFLDQGYQLIIPSRPGYGKTPSSTGRTAEAFADALVGLLHQRHLEQVIVLGISGGGPTALQLAGRHPARVSKVILQNAVTGGKFPAFSTRLGAYLLFNPWIERWTWAAFRSFAQAGLRVGSEQKAALRIFCGQILAFAMAPLRIGLASMGEILDSGGLKHILIAGKPRS